MFDEKRKEHYTPRDKPRDISDFLEGTDFDVADVEEFPRLLRRCSDSRGARGGQVAIRIGSRQRRPRQLLRLLRRLLRLLLHLLLHPLIWHWHSLKPSRHRSADKEPPSSSPPTGTSLNTGSLTAAPCLIHRWGPLLAHPAHRRAAIEVERSSIPSFPHALNAPSVGSRILPGMAPSLSFRSIPTSTWPTRGSYSGTDVCHIGT